MSRAKEKVAEAVAENAGTILVNVPKIQNRWMRFTIVGDSPLLTNRFGETALKSIEQGQQGGKKRGAKAEKPPREPEREFRELAYILDGDPGGDVMSLDLKKARFGFRAVAVKKSLVAAGFRFAEGSGRELNGVFFVHGPENGFIEIQSPNDPTRGRDHVVLQGKTSSIAYRPYFWPWKMDVWVRYTFPFTTREAMVNLFHIAGQCVGIGSWRVERGGDKGVFHVEEVIELPDGRGPFSGAGQSLSGGQGLQADAEGRGNHRAGSQRTRITLGVG